MTPCYEQVTAKLDADIVRVATQPPVCQLVWTLPREIKTELPIAPELDPDSLLPGVLGNFVMDEADRMPCPPDYIAAALMVSLGSVIGATCGLKPKTRDDWLVPPNLYGGIVGDPSAKKSPALGGVIKYLDHLEKIEVAKQAEAQVACDAEQTAFDVRHAAIKAEMKAAAGAPDGFSRMEAATTAMKLLSAPVKPQLRRFKTNDCTIEKLGDLLVVNRNGLLVYRDELMGLLSSWEKEGHEGDRAFYLEGWNGTASYCVDRIARGSTRVDNLCLSLFGGIQPELLERYLSSMSTSMDNDGRIQRFQVMVFPEAVSWEWRDRHPLSGAREAVQSVFESLAELDPVARGAQPADPYSKLPYFRFDDEAQEVFIEWSTSLHKVELPAERVPMMQQHLGKYEKLFCAIALILHLVEGGGPRVGAVNARRAQAWCRYLGGHARRIYALVDASDVTSANLLGARLGAGKLSDGFTIREIVRKQWRRLGTQVEVERALAVLEDHGWVQGIETESGSVGRPTVRYSINPRVRGVCL